MPLLLPDGAAAPREAPLLLLLRLLLLGRGGGPGLGRLGGAPAAGQLRFQGAHQIADRLLVHLLGEEQHLFQGVRGARRHLALSWEPAAQRAGAPASAARGACWEGPASSSPARGRGGQGAWLRRRPLWRAPRGLSGPRREGRGLGAAVVRWLPGRLGKARGGSVCRQVPWRCRGVVPAVGSAGTNGREV